MGEEDRVELGGNWIVATRAEEVAPIRPRVEMITREVAPIRTIVASIPYPHKVLNLNLAAQRFREGLRFLWEED